MKVSELIAELSKYPEDMEVVKGLNFGTWHSILRCELMDIYRPVSGKMAMEPIKYLKIV